MISLSFLAIKCLRLVKVKFLSVALVDLPTLFRILQESSVGSIRFRYTSVGVAAGHVTGSAPDE